MPYRKLRNLCYKKDPPLLCDYRGKKIFVIIGCLPANKKTKAIIIFFCVFSFAESFIVGYATLYSRVQYIEKKAFCLRRFLLLPRSLSSLHNPVQGLLCPFFAGSSFPPGGKCGPGRSSSFGRPRWKVRERCLERAPPGILARPPGLPCDMQEGAKGEGEISCGPGGQVGLTGSIVKNGEN